MAPKHTVRGFTLVELIMVLLLVGILAVVAIPRIFDSRAFEARGFHDATMSALRLAQKSAIAKRRTTCVAFTSTSVSLTLRSAANDSACSFGIATGEVGLESADTPYVVSAPPGTSFSAVPANLSFSGLGRASGGSVIGIVGEPNIVVEAETGYVHSP